MRLSSTGRRYELVEGELYETAPAGGRHGKVAIRIGILLGAYILENRLGEAFAAETGFILRRDPDTVRAPDFAFVSIDRLPPEGPPVGFVEMAPDLAVEVVSPGDGPGEVRDKVVDWLAAGTQMVWVIYPETRSVAVHRSKENVSALSEEDALEGSPVVPGFSCLVRELVLLGVPYPALPFLRLHWRV